MSLDTIQLSIKGSPHREIVGLIGINPTTYSKSRIMWNAAFAMHGIPMEYIPLDVSKEELPSVLDFLLGNQKVRGFNITVPYKEPTSIRPEIDVDSEARATGGINTVHRLNGRIYGHSTDGYGALTSIEENLFPGCFKGRQVLVLGAGGSGSAIAIACAQQGAHVTVANRTYEKAEELRNRAESHGISIRPIPLYEEGNGKVSPQLEKEMIVNASIIVNTINERDSGKLFADHLFDRDPNFMEVYMDIGYGKGHQSHFLESARKARHYTTLTGEWMLLHQAVKAFEYICAPEIAALNLKREDIVAPMRYAITNFQFDKPNGEIEREINAHKEEILKK